MHPQLNTPALMAAYQDHVAKHYSSNPSGAAPMGGNPSPAGARPPMGSVVQPGGSYMKGPQGHPMSGAMNMLKNSHSEQQAMLIKSLVGHLNKITPDIHGMSRTVMAAHRPASAPAPQQHV